MMKKIHILIISVLVLTMSLTACGDSVPDNGAYIEQKNEQVSSNVNNDDNDKEERIAPYSINTAIFMYLGKSPEEVAESAGEHSETIWFTGWWHRFGNYWFVFDDDYYPAGRARYLFCRLSDIVDGIASYIEAPELDKIFGHQASFFSISEHSELFIIGYLMYEYQGIEITIDAEPDTRVSKETFVRLRIL